jgi:hypothetical protein
MKTFEIYTKRSMTPVAVKLGWSWPGFFAGTFWLLVKGMWIALFFILVLWCVLLVVLSEMVNEALEFIISFSVAILLNILLGARGNRLRANHLKEKGYWSNTTINAKNPDVAISKFENPPSDKESKESQESVTSRNKDLIKRKLKESISSSKKNKLDYAEELKEAKALLNDDLINEEDYQKIKKKIIDGL